MPVKLPINPISNEKCGIDTEIIQLFLVHYFILFFKIHLLAINIVDKTSNTRSVTAQILKSLSRPQHVGNGCSPSPSGRSSVGFSRNNADSSNEAAAKYGNG